MSVKAAKHRDLWGHEREGYSSDHRQVAYAPVKPSAGPVISNWLHWEERLGSLGAGGGLIWGAHVAATHPRILDTLWQTNGPLELCAAATLVWLHAKWRRSTRLR